MPKVKKSMTWKPSGAVDGTSSPLAVPEPVHRYVSLLLLPHSVSISHFNTIDVLTRPYL